MTGHRTGFMFINANNTWVNACDAEQLVDRTTQRASKILLAGACAETPPVSGELLLHLQ